MVIERENNTIVIRPNGTINMEAVQKVIDYINVLEIVAKSQGTEEQAAQLAREVDNNWWQANKHRFLP